MRRSLGKSILAASCVGCLASVVEAGSLVNYSLLARPVGSNGAFGSTVTVSTGAVLEYELSASFAPVGTVNHQDRATKYFTAQTIAVSPARTVTLTAITATDGFNNMPRIDLFQSAGAAIDAQFTGSGIASSGWLNAAGVSVGVPTDGNLIGIKLARGGGSFDAAPVLYTGTFSIGSITGTSSFVGMRINLSRGVGGGFRVHSDNQSTASSGTSFVVSDITESNYEPYVSLNGLNLVQAVLNLPPSLTPASGFAAGDNAIDATLDLIYPLNQVNHSLTFTIPDSAITDEMAGSVSVALGDVPAALAGHIGISGRNITVTGSQSEYTALNGIYEVPLILTDSGSPALDSSGTFTLQIVPEPASLALMLTSGSLLLRRRTTRKIGLR